MGAVFKNECRHPEENYLFTMDIEGQHCDVWIVHKPNQQFFKGYIEFCLRYGHEDHEYRSSWDCNSVERGIQFHSKFADDDEESRQCRDDLIILKDKLKEIGWWDADFELYPEISELLYR